MSNIEESIKKDGVAMATTDGDSMYPMLITGDIAVVKKAEFPLKVSDVPVYHRDDHITMHRIVNIKNGRYIICGDNRIRFERDITEDKIIGVLSGFYHNGKFVSVEDSAYLEYCVALEKKYKMRAMRDFVIRVLSKIKRMIKC